MLPYQTLQEAELALGRQLTFAETIWFNYSAQKSDYYLYCHNIFFLFCIFSLVPLPVVLMELKASKTINKYKIQPRVNVPSQTVFKCYKDVIWMLIFVVGPLLLISSPIIKLVGIHSGLPLPSCSEMFLQLSVYFIVEDFSNYWIHRFFHRKWGYEKIHHVHHEYSAPIGFAAPYAHWMEMITLGIPGFLGPVMVPGHMVTFWAWICLRQMEAIETHCGYEFPWNPTKYIPFYGGAEFHDFHHYVGGPGCHSNFASVFTYCDYIYRTDQGYQCYLKQKHLEKIKELSFNGDDNGEPNENTLYKSS